MTQVGKEQVQMIKMQGQMIEELQQAVADLKRNLDQHDNYTPSSQKKRSRMSDTKKKWNDKSPRNVRKAERPRGQDQQARTHRV